MRVDVETVFLMVAIAALLFGGILLYLSVIRLKGTIYSVEGRRVELDRTRAALEADMRRMYEQFYRDGSRWDEINHLMVDMSKSARFRSREEQLESPFNSQKFLRNFGISPENIRVDQTQVFVLTPLSDEEVPVYNSVESACNKLGLRAIRGDEQNISGAILPVIIHEIIKSRFVIANLNGRNPNVFYEMGIAQAIGKDVLMFAHRDNVADVPFDVAQQRIIFYETQRQLHEILLSAIGQLGWSNGMSLSNK